MVTAVMEAESRLRVEEMIVLVDVEEMLIVEICRFVIDKLVVVAIGLVTDIAVLHVGKDIPLRRDVVECLHEGIAIEFLRVGIVVAIVAVLHEQGTQLVVAHVGGKAEVVAFELLNGQPAHDVPGVILVVQVPHQSIGILFESLLAHPVGTLYTA